MKRFVFLKYILLLFFAFQFGTSYSQLFISGQDPASLKWEQINTENFQVIFPVGFEKQAQYFANALSQAYELASKTVKTSPRKISVLIHNQSVISNGTTAWAPARIDAHATPPQDNYADHWLNQLAIHEFRHIVQIERMNTGLTKALGILLGEQAAPAVVGAYLPWWFIEGDAVVTETALSKSGRGRLPSFEMPLKAQLLEKGIYDYEKATHASFKDFTPISYELGYQMVAYGRSKYGANMWDDALENVARKPFSFTSFSSGIKNATGLSKRQFYEEAMTFLKVKWDSLNDNIKISDYKPITKNNKHYSNYLNPVFSPKHYAFAQKKSMDDVLKIVSIDKLGDEQNVLTMGSSYRESFSLGGNLLCWSEVEPDLRWANRNYSVIKLYNFETKVLASLTHKSRYFSPQLNRQGNKIATVEVGVNNEYRLIILDVIEGKEIRAFDLEDGSFMMNPTWSDDDEEIVMTVFNKAGKNIRILNVKNGEVDDILDYSFSEISRPQLIDNRVIFIADYSGIDNLYAFDRDSKEVTQISSVNFGVGNFSYDYHNKEIIFSNYTFNGFELVSQNIDPKNEILLSEIEINRFSFAEKLAAQEDGVLQIDDAEIKKYEVEKYRKSSGLFNFHSWTPLSIDLNTYEAKPGVMFMSQNLLSTAITTLGYEWDLDERLGKYFANFQYRGWYPVIDLNVEYAKEKDVYGQDTIYSYHQFETSIGISQPLNFSKNKFISGITPFARIKNTSRKVDKDFNYLRFPESNYQSLEYGLSAYHYLRSSLRDFYPKWGIISLIKYTHTPFTSLNKSNMFSIEAIVYAPGFMKHHGFKFQGGMQVRQVGTYNSSNIVSFIRGMSNPGVHDLYRFSVDYKFPLFYPDWNIGSVMYLKRLSMDLFYDYAYGTAPSFSKHYYSVGAEIQAKMHFISFIAPLNLGLRTLYMPDYNDFAFNVFLSIDFSFLK